MPDHPRIPPRVPRGCSSRASSYRPGLATLAAYPAVGFSKGTCILQQGLHPDRAYLIRSGIVKLSKLRSGRTLIAGLRSSGSMIGVEASLLRAPHSVTVVALTECSAIPLEAAELRRLLLEDPDVSWLVHLAQSEEVERHMGHAARLACLSARERLEDFFKLLRNEIIGDPEAPVELPLREWELAQLLGITPQYLSRLIHALEAGGSLERRGGRWHHLQSVRGLHS